MLKFTFCPTFTIFSFIFFITIVEILVYITTLIATEVKGYGLSNNNFLGPDYKILKSFGGNCPHDLRTVPALWRLITPVFLHASFMHIFVHSFSI